MQLNKNGQKSIHLLASGAKKNLFPIIKAVIVITQDVSAKGVITKNTLNETSE